MYSVVIRNKWNSIFNRSNNFRIRASDEEIKCMTIASSWKSDMLIEVIRVKKLNLESLESRRLKNDLRMYFKIIHGLVNIDASKFFIFSPKENSRTGHCYTLRKHLFSSNHLFNSFSNRAVDCWNSLPADVVGAKSYNVFNYKLKELALTNFLKGMP